MCYIKNLLLFGIIAIPLGVILQHLFSLNITGLQVIAILTPYIIGSIVADIVYPTNTFEKD